MKASKRRQQNWKNPENTRNQHFLTYPTKAMDKHTHKKKTSYKNLLLWENYKSRNQVNAALTL